MRDGKKPEMTKIIFGELNNPALTITHPTEDTATPKPPVKFARAVIRTINNQVRLVLCGEAI